MITPSLPAKAVKTARFAGVPERGYTFTAHSSSLSQNAAHALS